MASPEIDHLRKIATPSRLAIHLGKEVMGTPWVLHPWLQYVESRTLKMLSEPGRKILIISVPPQQGKTTFFGMWLPAWYLGMNPDNQVLFIAYSEEYAAGWGLKTRNIIDRYGPELFGVGLSKNSASVTNWKTAGDFGGMRSVGILGGITGNPGHLVLIDDVIKTMEDANSASAKRKHEEEWDGSIQTRWQEDTKIIITATRWAEDDLSGTLIERSQRPDYNGPPVEVIKLKAFAEPDEEDEAMMSEEELEAWRDCLGRKRGEHLQGQHSREFFLEKKPPSTDAFAFSALYQATPVSRVGGMFPGENWQFFDWQPDIVRKVRVWDLATTEDGGDWTVGALVGKDRQNRFYVLDIQRFRRNSADVESAVQVAAKSDGYGTKIKIERERAGAGIALVDTYKRKLLGYTVEPAAADGSKEQRAAPYSAEQNKRNVFLPQDAPWLEEFIKEHKAMTGTGRRPRHDDQIDTCAYAILELLDSGPVEIVDPADFAPHGVEDIYELADRLGYQLNG